MKKLFTLCLSFFLSQLAFSVSAYDCPIYYTQPDGQSLKIILKGDENCHWMKTLDGYPLIHNKSGFLTFATTDSIGNIIPSNFIATEIDQRDSLVTLFIKSNLINVHINQMQLIQKQKSSGSLIAKQNKIVPILGTRKGLIILIGFQDRPFSLGRTPFVNLFNELNYKGLSSGSVRDYFRENSFNQFDYLFDIVGPYISKYSMSYYGGNNYNNNDSNPDELIKEAIIAASTSVNFADYDYDNDGEVDNVHVIFAGYGEEASANSNAIWSHKSQLPTPITFNGKIIQNYSCSPELRSNEGNIITPIGVHCHELTHTLGVDDFYDTDYEENGGYSGTGSWDLMASGSWNNMGDTPAHINCFSKIYVLGWANASLIADSAFITMKPSYNHLESFFRINTSTKNEFFLLENRQKNGFDSALPYHGLMIYRIHPEINNVGNSINASHPQMCYPIFSSSNIAIPTSKPSSYGTINGSSCPFPGTSDQQSFTDISTPSSQSWSGENTNKPINKITESDSIITFEFNYNTTEENKSDLLLYSEDFEMGIPKGWNQQYISGSVLWLVKKMLGTDAVEGQTKCLNFEGNALSVNESSSRIISAPFNLSGLFSAHLEFLYKTKNHASFSLYFRIEDQNEWKLVESFVETSSEWNTGTTILPSPQDNYSIAFVGACGAGDEISLDNVRILGSATDTSTSVNKTEILSPCTIFTRGNQITVNTDNSGIFQVYSIVGTLVGSYRVSKGTTLLTLPHGVYVVNFNSYRKTILL